MRTKVIYQGKNEYNEHATINFVINGKGDMGNGQEWNEAESAVALSLANYIQEHTSKYTDAEPLFDGDTVWFCNDSNGSVAEWKEDIMDAYRNWKQATR